MLEGEQEIGLNWRNEAFVSHLRQKYRALHDWWILKPYTWVQDIGMIYVLVVSLFPLCFLVEALSALPQLTQRKQWVLDERTQRIRLANKAELVEAPKAKADSGGGAAAVLSAHDFRYVLDNPPSGKCFARTVSRFVLGARGQGRRHGPSPVVLMFEFANMPRPRLAFRFSTHPPLSLGSRRERERKERMNVGRSPCAINRVFVTLALFTIPVSGIMGILYGSVLKGEVADAISLASYIATAASLFFAILGAGSFLGVDAPHVYTTTDELLQEYVKQSVLKKGVFIARDPSASVGGAGGDNGKEKDAASV